MLSSKPQYQNRLQSGAYAYTALIAARDFARSNEDPDEVERVNKLLEMHDQRKLEMGVGKDRWGKINEKNRERSKVDEQRRREKDKGDRERAKRSGQVVVQVYDASRRLKTGARPSTPALTNTPTTPVEEIDTSPKKNFAQMAAGVEIDLGDF